ncbi:MAG: alanine--tRNA ligase [Acholeplasmataceae bacterium]
MKYLTSKEIRNLWLSYFESLDHKIIESASLIPKGDKTLLWINAGVAPLKKYFDGSQMPPSKRMVNIQKCIRTNDIENVGLTARHHTFFEMLGNFSIGDYFKEDAIKFGYDLMFSSNYFNFPKDKIYITYYPTDLVARDTWLSLGIEESHLIPSEEAFWEIGEGPCGPCTELHFDRGEAFDKRGVELLINDIENDRFVELWNIVFSQYNATSGVSREMYKELPNKNIDTGAGLERFASILQNTKTNFETDLFLPIIKKIEQISNIKYTGQMAFKVISDHIKTLVMAISDGAVLSNEGRGYVLRRLLRRALKHGRNLNIEGAFLTDLIPEVNEIMGEFYPNIIKNEHFIKKIILSEEHKFLETLHTGEQLIEKIIKEQNLISKEDSFMLFDTYGFPIELQEEYAAEHKIVIDKEGFYELLERQKERSRQSRVVEQSMQTQEKAYLDFKEVSTFIYDKLSLESEVIGVFEQGIVTKETPFYANMGGQVSDQGLINGYKVLDVIKLPNNQHLHIIEEQFDLGEIVSLEVDIEHRHSIMKNHTATHLLHQALKDVLGAHVNQQGSLVRPDLLRFDFNHYESLSDEDVLKIESIVKAYIKKAIHVEVKFMSYDEAISNNAIALFGEKYGSEVRVVFIDDYSVELCGGTHVVNTKDIENFLISSISSIGSGIYRVEAFSGINYINDLKERNQSNFQELSVLENKYKDLSKEAKSYNITPKSLEELTLHGSYQDMINLRHQIEHIKGMNRDLEKKIKEKKDRTLLSQTETLIKQMRGPVILTKDLDNQVLRPLLLDIYQQLNVETLMLVNVKDNKITYLIRSKDKAREYIAKFNEISKGFGGGNPTFAQGGSNHLELLEDLLKYMETL